MITIIAWAVFIPAVIWNLIFFAVAFGGVIKDQSEFLHRRNIRDAILSLVILFIPGIYLFGVF